MKHLLPFFVLTLMLSTQAVGQETYEILRIYNAESISIGNRTKKAGDTFKSTDQIVFSNDRQSFKAQKKGTSKAYYFNKKAMEAKKSNTLKDYFANDYRKAHGSTRGLSGNSPDISQGERNAAKYPEKRIALVIGNGNYQEADVLANALNDARDVSNRLKHLGFDVITLYDGDINDMQTTVNSFFQLAQGSQVALIYFAGHGIRYEGKDYLLSINRKGLGIKDECSLEYLIDESEKWKSSGKVMIFVIDACRNRAGFANAGDNRAIEAKKGTAILQSTSSGEVAMDADAGSGNSPFASAFINKIGQTGDDLEEEFLDIRREVKRKTSDRQVPRTSLGGGYDFHFCKGCNTSTPPKAKSLTTPTPQQSEKQKTTQENTPKSKTTPSQPKTTPSQPKTQPTAPQTPPTKKDTANTAGTTQGEEYDATHLSKQTQQGIDYFFQENYSEAIRCFKEAADIGDIEGMCWLGWCYSNCLYKYDSEEYRDYHHESRFTLPEYNNRDFSKLIISEKDNLHYQEAVKYFRTAANKGDANAQYNLGWCYYNGIGVSESSTEAVKWLRKAADKGNTPAKYLLGLYYERCYPKLWKDAIYWYQLAAYEGHVLAQYRLGKCYENGNGVDQSETEAEKWYITASDQNLAIARVRLTEKYRRGIGVEISKSKSNKWAELAKEEDGNIFYITAETPGSPFTFGEDSPYRKYEEFLYLGTQVPITYTKAVERYQTAAKQGDANAQYILGWCYFNGWGVTHSYTEAAKWFQMAANQGYLKALYMIGYCCSRGYGCSDYDKALKYYRKAAELGDAKAQYQLGRLYNHPSTKIDKNAVKWFRKSALQGYLKAQLALGDLYYNQVDRSKNKAECVQWYKMAAEQGDTMAMIRLADIYSSGGREFYSHFVTIVSKNWNEAAKWYLRANAYASIGDLYAKGGYGITQNWTEAAEWYRMAAEKGDMHAQYKLGSCYKDGNGVPKSDTEAKKWFRLAAEKGHKDAKKELESMK